MPVTSKDLIALSDQLFGSGTGAEVEIRAAAGRAYYAVYHEAVEVADKLSLAVTNKNTGEHAQLCSRYSGTSSKKLKAIASRIWAVKKMRTAADYHNTTKITAPGVKHHIASCKSILDELDRLATAASCSQSSSVAP